MEAVDLVKFLKHLITCTEALMGKEEIDAYDVRSIRRELSELKRHIDGKETVDPVVLDQILGLEFRVDESLLSDSKKSVWLWVLGALSRRFVLTAYTRANRQEALRRQVGEFRNDLDHLRFALEL